MRITIKLYALLSRYLPPGAKDNQADLEVGTGTTPAAVMALLGLPRAHCHLVLINGAFTPPGEIDRAELKDGDALAIWPPVAGG